MIECKGTYCFMVISAKDDLPVGVFDTYLELSKFYDISVPTIWRAIKYHALVKGKYYIEKILL